MHNKWSKWFDIRPHSRRRRTVQSYSPGGANVSSHVGTLTPPESTTQTANRLVQPFLHSSLQSVVGYIGATWRIRLKLCTLAPPDKYNWTCASFGPPESTTQTANWSVQPFLHSSRQNVSNTIQWATLSPNCPFSWGDLDSHLIHDSLGHSEPTVRTVSRSVQLFLHRWPQSVPILYNGRPFTPKLPLPMGGSGLPSNTWFLGPIRAHNLYGIWIGSVFFAQMTAEYPYTLQWDAHFRPQNCPFPWRRSGPPSNTWFTGPIRVLVPNGISIGSAVLQRSLV